MNTKIIYNIYRGYNKSKSFDKFSKKFYLKLFITSFHKKIFHILYFIFSQNLLISMNRIKILL
jgi:hypothetical protein